MVVSRWYPACFLLRTTPLLLFEKVFRLFPKINTLLATMFSVPITPPGAHICTHKEKNTSSIKQAKRGSFFEKKCYVLALQGYIYIYISNWTKPKFI